MSRSARKDTPTVISVILYVDGKPKTIRVLRTNGEDDGIRLSKPEWSAWLEGATGFYYEHEAGSFSVRKQHHRQKFFWYAYKRINGTQYKVYLGRCEDITEDKLEAMAVQWPEVVKKWQSRGEPKDKGS